MVHIYVNDDSQLDHKRTRDKMRYRVHRVEVNKENMQEKLEELVNKVKGDVVAVIPNVRPTVQWMGATSKVDFLLVAEKVA